jgi:hypothetical protein
MNDLPATRSNGRTAQRWDVSYPQLRSFVTDFPRVRTPGGASGGGKILQLVSLASTVLQGHLHHRH